MELLDVLSKIAFIFTYNLQCGPKEGEENYICVIIPHIVLDKPPVQNTEMPNSSKQVKHSQSLGTFTIFLKAYASRCQEFSFSFLFFNFYYFLLIKEQRMKEDFRSLELKNPSCQPCHRNPGHHRFAVFQVLVCMLFCILFV